MKNALKPVWQSVTDPFTDFYGGLTNKTEPLFYRRYFPEGPKFSDSYAALAYAKDYFNGLSISEQICFIDDMLTSGIPWEIGEQIRKGIARLF